MRGAGTVATFFHLRILAAMLTTLAISNYRSLRDLVVPLERLNVVTGANGSGKSSLYRSLRLLAETAQGGLVTALAPARPPGAERAGDEPAPGPARTARSPHRRCRSGAQAIVVTHSESLIGGIAAAAEVRAIRLEKSLGETTIADLSALERPAWSWPPR